REATSRAVANASIGPFMTPPSRPAAGSFQLVHVVQHAPGDADGQDREPADRLVPDAPGDVNDDARVQLDLLVVEDHRAAAVAAVIDLIGLLVVVELGVVDLDVVDLGRGAVSLLDEGSDLAAGLGPGRNVRGVAAEEPSGRAHGTASRRVIRSGPGRPP